MSHLNTNDEQTETAVKINDKSIESRPKCWPVVHAIQQSWTSNGSIKFIITALGIFLSFIYVGVLQEKIMRGCYGDESNKTDCPPEKRFKHAISLVAVQMLCAYTLVKIMDLIKPEPKDSTHFFYYICAALANFTAMASSNTALRWVSYPMQVIFKSAKPIAVMIIGLMICKRYTIQRYVFVLMIVIGVAMFKLFESQESKAIKKDKSADVTNWEQIGGIGLLTLSLSMDGALGAIQDRIKDVYSPSSRQMMLSITFYVTIMSGSIALVNGELYEVYNFAQVHPNILWHLASFGIVGSIGMLFLFIMISSFGSLACSVTTTVRKFFSVVLSIAFFHNPSTPIQWIGAVIVFSALLADTFFGKRKRNTERREKDIEGGETGEKLIKAPENAEMVAKSNGHSQIAQQNV